MAVAAPAPEVSARPRWATPLAIFCALTVAFTAWRDLCVPQVRDTEVWLGIELHGALARATAPLHWLLFAAAAWGFAGLRPWIWPWASVYTCYVAVSHLIWSEASPKGQGWPMGLLQAAGLSVLAWFLLRARPAERSAAASLSTTR